MIEDELEKFLNNKLVKIALAIVIGIVLGLVARHYGL